MLLVKTYLSNDNYGGTGCFSAEFIAKDRHVWKWDEKVDIRYKAEDLILLPREKQEELKKYGYPVANDYLFVEISLDNGRYMNHSEIPNFMHVGYELFAAYDIEIGTELMTNYFDLDPELRFCGSFLEKIKS